MEKHALAHAKNDIIGELERNLKSFVYKNDGYNPGKPKTYPDSDDIYLFASSTSDFYFYVARYNAKEDIIELYIKPKEAGFEHPKEEKRIVEVITPYHLEKQKIIHILFEGKLEEINPNNFSFFTINDLRDYCSYLESVSLVTEEKFKNNIRRAKGISDEFPNKRVENFIKRGKHLPVFLKNQNIPSKTEVLKIYKKILSEYLKMYRPYKKAHQNHMDEIVKIPYHPLNSLIKWQNDAKANIRTLWENLY